MVVNRVTQVEAIYAECRESGDKGAMEDVREGEWCPVVLCLPQTEEGEQRHAKCSCGDRRGF